MSELRPNPHRLDLPGAARYLGVDEAAVGELTAAGFLTATTDADGLWFALADLKAFVARNADNGSGNLPLDGVGSVDPQALLDALDGRSEEMARRAFEIFAAAFPEARSWSLGEQARFVGQARNRFEAILAVTGQGAAVDEALVGDLQDVGAAAAWAGSPLPQVLAVLRISRDLVVQTAVELAEQRGRHWGLALSLLLTRILPAMDRLTDALAQGYWAAQVGREEEMRDRYEHVVETSSNGVFEVDLDGRIQYANPSLGVMLGRGVDELQGLALGEALDQAEGGAVMERLINEAGTGAQQQVSIVRPDGVRRVLEVHATPRYRFDGLVGYQGVVQDLTAALDLEARREEFLRLVTRDLRGPLAALLAQGANLEANASELPSEQVARMGFAIRNQAERISRLADDLHDVTRLASSSLAALAPRAVDLASVVHAALASVPTPRDVEVRIPFGVEVLADARRLEQVVANLVENGLTHGAPPVVVNLDRAANGRVDVSISDQGQGLDPTLASTLLVHGLVEAMGGTVGYRPPGGAGEAPCFLLSLPQPRRP